MVQLKLYLLIAVAIISVSNSFRSSITYRSRGFKLNQANSDSNSNILAKEQRKFAALSLCFLSFLSPMIILPGASSAIDQQYKLPPIDRKDPNRCTLTSSSMGQANAARDKLYDLRECNLQGQSAAGKDISGMIGSDADFTGVNFKETQLSK